MIIPFEQIQELQGCLVGGKGYVLGKLTQSGYQVPKGFCITTEAYHEFVQETGLSDLIQMELSRKNLGEMRWEEIWDTALRIRNLFLRTEIPGSLHRKIYQGLLIHCSEGPFAMRSSSPEEDSAKTSFAGLHDSFINLAGTDSIIKHIKLVWASLWSNRALLYRRELNLNPSASAMAVVIQELIEGDSAGIIFSRDPNDSSQSVVEAVYGLNQGLVDGTIEPDRWLIERSTGKISEHLAKNRCRYQTCSESGMETRNLPLHLSQKPPVSKTQIAHLYATASKLETLFQAPQDIEWTFRNGVLFILQARPVTHSDPLKKEDKRLRYLSLQRSFENLKQLHYRVESVQLPKMESVAESLAKIDLSSLTDHQLAEEITRRENSFQDWRTIYWDEFIPFAHGVRLFGEFYNDSFQPEDPAEFTRLLVNTQMISLSRNDKLHQLAQMIRSNRLLAQELKLNNFSKPICQPFMKLLEDFYLQFSELSWGQSLCFKDRNDVLKLLLEMTQAEIFVNRQAADENILLKNKFFNRFHGKQRDFAKQLLELACASYRLRDDDNIYLGKIESQLIRAVDEGKRRIEEKSNKSVVHLSNNDVRTHLEDSNFSSTIKRKKGKLKKKSKLKPRQMIGQPASPGFVTGVARVITSSANIGEIKSGEVLVCEAIDPNMTFIVPLSCAIVETRGGMLIHGAIIAREYHLPCVTGIPEATQRIDTGDTITVDGYLGIVTIQKASVDRSNNPLT